MTGTCKHCQHEKRWHDFSHHAGACSYVECDCTRYVPQVPQNERIREYQRQRTARIRAEWLAANGPCAICGRRDGPMKVEHIDRSQKVSHIGWGWARDRLAAELAKCRVLCEACYCKRLAEGLRRPIRHGTRSGYFYHGCRCDACRRFVREQRRAKNLSQCACGKRKLATSMSCRQCAGKRRRKKAAFENLPYSALPGQVIN